MPDVGGMSSSTDAASAEETRRQALEDRLRHRDNQRLEALEAKRLAREETAAEHESVEFFTREFAAGADAIARDIADATAGKVAKAGLPTHFETVNDAIQRLTKYLADSKLFLPTYDLRKSQEKIDSLNDGLNAARNSLLPKKKFGFKNKGKAKAVAAAATSSVNDSAKTTEKELISKAETTAERDEGDFVFKDKTKQLLGASETLDNRVVGLFRLEDCDLLLRGSPSALHVRDLRRCRVFVGPTSGSIFVDRCNDCVFVLACQQLRIHTTVDTSFYIHVTSKAIVEDCSRVAFAPYNLDYSGLDADYTTSGLDRSRNNWQYVDDFNFLATEAVSPNWRVLAEDERIPYWAEDIQKIMKELPKVREDTTGNIGGGDVG